MKRFICILMALFMLACAVSCTKTDENGGATTVGGTTADVTTVPDDTALGDDTTAADTTASDTTAGDTTIPETTVPETTIPETTVPETTVPETTVPETTVPETTVPETTVPETTVPETTVPETTAEDPMKKIVDEALGYIEEKKYQKAYDLLKKHESNAQAKALLENFYFLPVKSERVPVEGSSYRNEIETFTYDKNDRLINLYRYNQEYVFEYDSKGRLIKITYDDKRDGDKSVQTFTYNSKGQLIEVDKKYTGIMISDRNEKYTYHSSGYLSKKVVVDEGITKTYVYNKNGDVTKFTMASPEDNVVYEYDITYKKKGQPQNATVLCNGENVGTIEMTYSKDGTSKKMELLSPDGLMMTSFEYTYKNGRVVKEMRTDIGEGTYKSREYAYDSKGRLTKNYHWGDPDDFWSGYEYKYDSNGNVTNITRLDTNEKIYSRKEYKYDKYGNLISAYEIDKDNDEYRYEYEYRLAYITYDIDENVKSYMNVTHVEKPAIFLVWGDLVLC